MNAGAVDFALLFVANYGNARGKKYSDPTDLGHAVEMLREVLGQVSWQAHSQVQYNTAATTISA